MPRKKKQETEGACASCRKLVPLVQADGGLLVLRTHHVVVAVEHYHGHGVEECGGSGGEPAALDDDQDWAWVAEPTGQPFKTGGLLGVSGAPLAEAIRATGDSAGAALNQMRDAFARLPDASMGFSLGELSRVEVNGVDLTDAISSVEINPPSEVQPNFTATVLTALRQAWIDETGAPPRDATVTLEPDLIRDLQVMNIVFEPYGLRVSVPIHGNAPDMPGFAEAAGQEAAGVVRRGLRERMETRCAARDALHECDQPRGSHDHLCRICDWRWRDPVTPVLPPYAHGA